MSPSLLHGSEDPSGLHHVLSTSITPLDVGRISLLEDGDGLSIDDELPILCLDCAVELAMGGIILEHVDLGRATKEGGIKGLHLSQALTPSTKGQHSPCSEGQ